MQAPSAAVIAKAKASKSSLNWQMFEDNGVTE